MVRVSLSPWITKWRPIEHVFALSPSSPRMFTRSTFSAIPYFDATCHVAQLMPSDGERFTSAHQAARPPTAQPWSNTHLGWAFEFYHPAFSWCVLVFGRFIQKQLSYLDANHLHGASLASPSRSQRRVGAYNLGISENFPTPFYQLTVLFFSILQFVDILIYSKS